MATRDSDVKEGDDDDLDADSTRVDVVWPAPDPFESKPPVFEVFAGPDRGRVFPLAKDETWIGRGMDNDVVLADLAVSRRHLRVTKGDGNVELEDVGSGNGCRVNKLPTRLCDLRDGDRIEIGETVLIFRRPVAAEASESQPLPVFDDVTPAEASPLFTAAPTQPPPEPVEEAPAAKRPRRDLKVMGIAFAAVACLGAVGVVGWIASRASSSEPIAPPSAHLRGTPAAQEDRPSAPPPRPSVASPIVLRPDPAPADPVPAVPSAPTPADNGQTVPSAPVGGAASASPAPSPQRAVPFERDSASASPANATRPIRPAAPATSAPRPVRLRSSAAIDATVLAAYRAGDFDRAAREARSAAETASPQDARTLTRRADRIERFAREYRQVRGGELTGPPLLRHVQIASELDQEISGGRYASELRPLLLRAYIAQASDSLAGGEVASGCRRVRQAAEIDAQNRELKPLVTRCDREANTVLTRARGLEASNREEAIRQYRDVLAMASSSTTVYQVARDRLRAIDRATVVDEDE